MDEPSSTAPRRAIGPWRSLLIIAFVFAAMAAFCQWNPWFDNAVRVLSTTIACGLAAVALFGWLLRLLRLERTTRRRAWIGLAIGVALFAAAMRTKYEDGNLHLSFRPRNWVLNLARRAGVDVNDVIHAAGLADPPLVLEPTPDDSPQFLGPSSDGRLHLASGRLARDWTKNPPRLRWRIPMGPAWSSFATVGRYAFTQQQTTDLRYEQVVCYDLTDGSLKWVHGDERSFTSSMGGDGPRATPTYYAGKLVTIGGDGLLNCLDAATGRLLWSHDVVAESDAVIPDWGISSSPLVFKSEKHGDLVVQSAGGTRGNSLHAFRLEDGEPVWRVGNDPPGYSSPRLYTFGGVPQIILVNWQAATGHDPETGAELWRFDDAAIWTGSQPKVPQPVVVDDRRILLAAGYGVGCVMLEVTRDAAGKWSATSQWKSAKLKPKFTNLVVRDGHAYGLDDGEFLICLDLEKGDVRWRSKRGTNYGHGQVLLVDDLLLVQTESGDVALVAADPAEFRELTRFTALTEGTSWNVPVLSGKLLVVRNEKQAACFELPLE